MGVHSTAVRAFAAVPRVASRRIFDARVTRPVRSPPEVTWRPGPSRVTAVHLRQSGAIADPVLLRLNSDRAIARNELPAFS